MQSDIEANQGDNPDEQDTENHPHDPHGESEPSEVVSIHSNSPDSNDRGPSEHHPHDDHGSDVEEDPELKENSVDSNDEAHRVPHGNDSEAPESEEEEVFDVVRPTEPLTISKKWERAYRERPPKPVITKRASIPVLPNTRQTLERTYIHRIYQPAKLRPAPQPFSRVVEKTYIVKPTLPVRCEASPERYSRLDEEAYFERIFDRKVIHPIAGTVKQTVETARHHPAKLKRVVEPSPEPYRKIVEVARQERIFDRKVIHPIAGTVKQTVETARHHPAKLKRVVEPSPEPYRKIVEVARRERIFDKARVESSPEPFLKKEEVAKYKKAFERKVCQPSEAIYSQIIENHYFEKIWTPHRVRPQVSPYQSIVEQTYYVRAYDPLPLEPLTQRLETKIEEYYFMKIFTRPRIQPSPARYEQYLERAYYQRINRKARGVAPALSIEAKLETCYIARIHQRKRIIPQTMSCLLERCYVHRTVVWDNAEEAASVNSASRAGESHAETSEYASARLGPDSERGSQIGHDDQNDNDDQPEEDQAVEVQPANVEEFSSQLEQSETLSAGSQGSMGKSRRRFGRTNPDEKFPCWILNEDHEPEQALISSPEGFWIDLDNGKLEVMAGDPVHVEPLIAEKFDEVDSVARKRDDAKDPDCDFIIKDENKKRRQVIINPDKLPIKKSNCQLYDPEDQKVCRAKIRLCGHDPETGEPIKYFNGVLVDENHKVSHVLVKQIDEERLLMKRTKDSTTEEIITKEKITMVGDVPAKVITLDPFYTQKSRAEQVYIPAEPFRVYKTPLLDAEEAKATSVEDDRIFEGPILVEPVHEGRTHEVFMLIPPEKRDESQIRESYIPRYVRVEPDFEIKEEQKKFDDFKNTVHQEAETQKKLEETGPSKPANNRPVSPKALKPLAVDRVDLKVADLVPTRDSLKPARRQEAHEDLDDSALGCFDSLKNSEELYYEIDYDEKKASKPELTESRGSRTNLRTNDPDQVSNGKANSQHNRSSLDQSESNISSRRPSSQASYKVVPAQKPKKTSTTSPKIVEGPARIRFDTISDDNKKMKFVGIGKLSNPDTERSPKKYSEQLKDVKNRAASTIQLFCLYCLKKPRWRQVFLKKYKRAKTELGSEALFRRFLLHYVCLPTQVSVEKALENYLKVLSKSHK